MEMGLLCRKETQECHEVHDIDNAQCMDINYRHDGDTRHMENVKVKEMI